VSLDLEKVANVGLRCFRRPLVVEAILKGYRRGGRGRSTLRVTATENPVSVQIFLTSSLGG
jgi:hypothetical protein